MTLRFSTITRLILLLFVLWFGSYCYLYFFERSGFKPLYSYFLLFGYFTFWLVVTRKPTGFRDRGTQAFLLWLGIYLAYGALAFFNSTQDEIAVQAFIGLGEAILISAAFVLPFAERRNLLLTQTALGLLALFAAIVNFFDFLNPVFTIVPGRAAGLYENPNISGHFIAMAMVAGIGVIPPRLRSYFIGACGVGILLTFSRASWILWGLGVILLGVQGYIGPFRHRWLAGMLGAVIAIGFLGAVFTGLFGNYVADTGFISHLDANTQARLGIGTASWSGYAAEERQGLALDSLKESAEAPFKGHGLGYTSEWQYPVGPHDMYLLFLVEGGIPGALLYLSLMLLIWRYSTGTGRVVALQLIVAGLFTHNQLEQPAFLMMLAFVVSQNAAVRASSLHGRVQKISTAVPA